ncbi:hypothetical protein DP116_18060 [Brasilonema bromeliae SPC951]|uniref:Transposase n=1 Tax=Brasilonema bromeliae SPC951 TaxID=385972 RepID=A0ABX1PA27_9CYAN|nr:hypothetical protein [Brasilonema bromeliae SPC951]
MHHQSLSHEADTQVNKNKRHYVIANGAKRNEAIARVWDCFASLRYARNDILGLIRLSYLSCPAKYL